MEVTSLHFRSLMCVLMLLNARDQHRCRAAQADGFVLRVVPNRLQFLEFDSFMFTCAGSGDFSLWRVIKSVHGVKSVCGDFWDALNGTCHIKNAYEIDSGEYWCDTNGGVRSRSVTVTVTAGPVILVSPASPVHEGEDVTLGCMNRETPSAVADLYKDGVLQGGNMTIHSVLKSDEGLYKCNIPGVGESAESWLAVRAGSGILQSPTPPVTEGDGATLSIKTQAPQFTSSHRRSYHTFIVGTSNVLSMLVLVVGLCLCWRHRALFFAPWKSLLLAEIETVYSRATSDQ